jgi:hypothetical protein
VESTHLDEHIFGIIGNLYLLQIIFLKKAMAGHQLHLIDQMIEKRIDV